MANKPVATTPLVVLRVSWTEMPKRDCCASFWIWSLSCHLQWPAAEHRRKLRPTLRKRMPVRHTSHVRHRLSFRQCQAGASTRPMQDTATRWSEHHEHETHEQCARATYSCAGEEQLLLNDNSHAAHVPALPDSSTIALNAASVASRTRDTNTRQSHLQLCG